MSVVMEEKRSNDGASSLESGKRKGTSKRDSEVAATEVEGNSRENSVPEAKGRKDFRGGRERVINYVKSC